MVVSIHPPSVRVNLIDDMVPQLLAQLQREGYVVDETFDPFRACIAWCNVRFRHIPRRQRRVIRSQELQRRQLPPPIATSVSRICKAAERGENLNPHLSRQYVDSGFNDMLHHDWRIHHMHLGPRGGRFAGRTGPLLFAYVEPEVIYLIDVRDHRSFAEDALIEIMHTNWPAKIPLKRLPGVVGFESGWEPLTATERAEVRRAGVTTPVTTSDGTMYWPLGGYATSGDSVRAVTETDRILEMLRRVQDELEAQAVPVAALIEKETGVRRASLNLKLVVGGTTWRVVETGSRVEIGRVEVELRV